MNWLKRKPITTEIKIKVSLRGILFDPPPTLLDMSALISRRFFPHNNERALLLLNA